MAKIDKRQLIVRFAKSCLGCSLIILVAVSAGSIENPEPSPITPESFGMHLAGDHWPSVPIGGRRLTLSWTWVQKSRGTWDYTHTDSLVQTTTSHNVDLVAGLAFSPSWASTQPNGDCVVGRGACWEPANLQDWREYVKAMGNRYKGQVHLWEIWNEPNEGAFYHSSVGALVTLTQAAREELKKIDPNNQIISPSPVGAPGFQWMDQFLQKGGGNYVDIVGFHFYFAPSPPESVFGEVMQVRSIMAKYGVRKPLWNTEFGWTGDKLDEHTAIAYLGRAMILSLAAGTPRAYWYQWGNPNVPLPLVREDGMTPTPAGKAFGILQEWLVGAVLKSCTSADIPQAWHGSHAPWTCDLQRGDTISKIIWNPGGASFLQVPASWHVNRARNLEGDVTVIPPKGTGYGIQPLLLYWAP
jgi:hypothetical protein